MPGLLGTQDLFLDILLVFRSHILPRSAGRAPSIELLKFSILSASCIITLWAYGGFEGRKKKLGHGIQVDVRTDTIETILILD